MAHASSATGDVSSPSDIHPRLSWITGSGLGRKSEEGRVSLNYSWKVEKKPVWVAEIPPSAKALSNIDLSRDLSFTALSIPDNPLALLHVESSVFAQLLRKRLGCEVIAHLTCRDLSRLAIKSRILALALCGVEHILALTGDHPKMGPEESAPVFDLDSIRLIYLARIMSDYGVDELGE
jgi:5,10-methylenetetrahydrofolate reductase